MTEENGQGSVAQGMAERKFERKAVRDERRVERRQRRRLAETLEPLLIRERIRNQWEVLELERRFFGGLGPSARFVVVVFCLVHTPAGGGPGPRDRPFPGVGPRRRGACAVAWSRPPPR